MSLSRLGFSSQAHRCLSDQLTKVCRLSIVLSSMVCRSSPSHVPKNHKLPMLPKDCTRDASLSPNIGDGRSSHVGVQAGWCQPQTSESLSKVESEFREIHVGQPGLTGGPNVGRPSTPTTGPTPTMMITKKADNFESGALTFVQSTEQSPIVHCPVAHGPSMQSKPCNNHPPQGVTACTHLCLKQINLTQLKRLPSLRFQPENTSRRRCHTGAIKVCR